MFNKKDFRIKRTAAALAIALLLTSCCSVNAAASSEDYGFVRNEADFSSENATDDEAQPDATGDEAQITATADEVNPTATGDEAGYNKEYDFNSDGIVDINDCTAMQMFLAGYSGVYGEYPDVNSDGVTDINDVTAFQFYLANPDKRNNSGVYPLDVLLPSNISLNADSLTMGVGEAYLLEMTSNGRNFEYSYTSGNPEIASVDESGRVCALSPGSTVITLQTESDLVCECPVTVKEAPSEVTLNYPSLTIGVGDVCVINQETNSGSYAMNFSWESDNEEVASVEAVDGTNEAVITAKKTGTATIYVTLYNGVLTSCAVTVREAPAEVTLNQSELTFGAGETFTLSEKTNSGSYAFNFEWISDNEDVVSVQKVGNTNKAVLTAKKAGTAEITVVLYNGITASCAVKVANAPTSVTLNKTELLLSKGDTFEISEKTNSGSYAKSFEWISSDKNVATVEYLTGNKAKITAKNRGAATITIKTYNGITAKCIVYVKTDSYKISNVPLIGQSNLPTGCETCSATMLLQYYGYNISETSFADNYLICRDLTYKNDRYYGPDPNSAFVGSPYSSYSFGAYAPVMAKSMNKYLSGKSHKAVCLEGESLDYLCGKYVAQGQPVMIWATINMSASYKTTSWTVNYTDENAKYSNGSTYTWTAGEHCLVLTGYDNDNYYFNDPWTNKRCSYSKSVVNSRYSELGKQAVVMQK